MTQEKLAIREALKGFVQRIEGLDKQVDSLDGNIQSVEEHIESAEEISEKVTEAYDALESIDLDEIKHLRKEHDETSGACTILTDDLARLKTDVQALLDSIPESELDGIMKRCNEAKAVTAKCYKDVLESHDQIASGLMRFRINDSIEDFDEAIKEFEPQFVHDSMNADAKEFLDALDDYRDALTHLEAVNKEYTDYMDAHPTVKAIGEGVDWPCQGCEATSDADCTCAAGDSPAEKSLQEARMNCVNCEPLPCSCGAEETPGDRWVQGQRANNPNK